MTERGLSFKVFPDHRHHFARDSSQTDIIDQEQAQADAGRVGVFPAVLLARHRARFKFPARTSEHQLLAPDAGLVGYCGWLLPHVPSPRREFFLERPPS